MIYPKRIIHTTQKIQIITFWPTFDINMHIIHTFWTPKRVCLLETCIIHISHIYHTYVSGHSCISSLLKQTFQPKTWNNAKYHTFRHFSKNVPFMYKKLIIILFRYNAPIWPTLKTPYLKHFKKHHLFFKFRQYTYLSILWNLCTFT